MNIQTTIGTILILSAIALTSIVFNWTPESTDQPSVSTGFNQSPRGLSQFSPTADLNQSNAAMEQAPPVLYAPLVGPNSVPNNLASASVAQISDRAHLHHRNAIQVTPMQSNQVYAQPAYEIPERANPSPVTHLPGLNENPNTIGMAAESRVFQRQALNQPQPQPRGRVAQVQQDFKNPLKEHYSTDRPKYIENRYANSDSQSALASRVLALERDLARGNAEAPQADRWPDHPAIRQANYESKASGPARSVLTNEPILLDPEVGFELDPADQQAGVPRQIAPENIAMGMSMQQPALQRLRVNPQVEVRAGEHIEYGESLARRNSYLAAREEYTLALLLIARSHKAQFDPEAYSKRLAQGLTALDEAADLAGPNSEWSQQSLLQQKILSHKTRLISPDDIDNISRTQALDYYYGFAQSQIELAIGHSAAGSAALFMLGKIETRSSVNNRRSDWTGQARALVFFRAAMSCNPANAACSNELGVLLHDMGRLKEAESALKVSVTSSPTRSAWANLAAVHNQLAMNSQVAQERNKQLQLARQAAMKAEQSGYNFASSGGTGEQWATLSEFHNNAAFPNVTMQPAAPSRQQNSSQKIGSTAETLLQKVKGWY